MSEVYDRGERWDTSTSPAGEGWGDISRMFKQIGDAQLNRAYEALLGGELTAEEVAAKLLQTAHLLIGLQRSEQAISLIEMFENLGITETAETAAIFALYRVTRMDLWHQSDMKSDPDYLAMLVAEQEQSPNQNPDNALLVYEKAFELGHEPSYAAFLRTAFEQADVSLEQASEYDPAPSLEKARGLLFDAFWRDIQNLGSYDKQSSQYVAAEDRALQHIQIFENAFHASTRKALIAQRLGYSLHIFIDDPRSERICSRAEYTRVAMYFAGIDSPVDRRGEPIVYTRLHKHLISDLIGFVYKRPHLRSVIEPKFTEWMLDGIFEDADLRKIQKWVTMASNASKPKKRRRSR